jgi:hypothetical protein
LQAAATVNVLSKCAFEKTYCLVKKISHKNHKDASLLSALNASTPNPIGFTYTAHWNLVFVLRIPLPLARPQEQA